MVLQKSGVSLLQPYGKQEEGEPHVGIVLKLNHVTHPGGDGGWVVVEATIADFDLDGFGERSKSEKKGSEEDVLGLHLDQLMS